MADTENKPTNGDSTPVEISPLEQKVIEQIEYYFSDINLARDKFLQGEIKKDEGWVELTTMLKFARLAKLTSEAPVIVEALKKAPNKLMVVNEEGTKIRRSPEKELPTFDIEFVKDLISQSLYVKYIPLDASLDDIKEFFSKTAGDGVKITNVIMRNYQDKIENKKKFKGSIFITFDSKANAEKFLNENKDKKIKFNESCENELLLKWQQEYNEEKKQEIRSKQNKKNKVAKTEEGEEKPEAKPFIVELPKKAILKVSNIKEPITREDIREVLEKVQTEEEEIVFIEFEAGQAEAFVRYKKENSAEVVFKALGVSEVEIKDIKVNIGVLDGEEEEKVLEKMKMDIFLRRQKLQNEKKSGKKFGKKGRRGGGGGQKRSRGGDFESNKRQRVESN